MSKRKQKAKIMNITEQVNKIIFENEQLIASLERLRNENNIIKIEIQELTLSRDNENASKVLLASNKEHLQKTVEGLQKDLNEVYGEMEELNEKYQKLKKMLAAAEERAGCTLGEMPDWKTRCLEKAEEVEIFRRELAFCKGSGAFSGISRVDDTKTERVLAEFYSLLNLNNRKSIDADQPQIELAIIPMPTSKESVLNDHLLIIEEELVKKRTESNERLVQIRELQNRLSVSKNVIEHFENELGVIRTHSFLQDKKSDKFDFRRAIQNIETLDSKLKVVYSSCIDLFFHLDKSVLIQMEKKLDDCIIELKKIRDLLLNQL